MSEENSTSYDYKRSLSPNSLTRPARKKGKISKDDLLKSAAIMGDCSMIDSLLNEDSAFTESRDEEGNSPLHHCAEHGHVSLVKLLLDKSANVNAENVSLSSPLHIAAVNGNHDVILLLLESKAEINHQDIGGITALHWAVIFKKYKCIKLLLKKNANPNCEDAKGLSPLHVAVISGKESSLTYLLKYKAKIDKKSSGDGNTPLNMACLNNKIRIVEYLLEKKSDPNIQNNNGESCLHSAVKQNSIPLVQYLLDYNANPDIKDKDGKIPRQLTTNDNIRKILSTFRTIFVEDDWCIVENVNKKKKLKITEAIDDNDKSDIVEQFGQHKNESTYVHILDEGKASVQFGLKLKPHLIGKVSHSESLICPVLVKRNKTRPIIRKLAQFLTSKLNSDTNLSEINRLRQSAPSFVQTPKKKVNTEPLIIDIDSDNEHNQNNLENLENPVFNSNSYQPLTTQLNTPYTNCGDVNMLSKSLHVENSMSLPINNTNSTFCGYANITTNDIPKLNTLHSSADSINESPTRQELSPLRLSAGSLPVSIHNNNKKQDNKLVSLLEDLGLEQYIQTFIEEEWDWEALLEVTHSDLLGLGIKSGSRRKLMSAISKFREDIKLDINSSSPYSNEVDIFKDKFSSKQVQHLKNTCNYIIEFKEIKKCRYLGKGFYGEVFLGNWNGINVAVKQVTRPVDSINKWLLEIELLHKLRHPNIVMFYCACVDAPNYCIVLEYVPRGSLETVLLDPMIQINHERRLAILCDIARGMKYLHSQNPPILHRDLKSDNVLIDEKWCAKVSDFGLSRYKDETYSYGKATTPFDVTITPSEVLQLNHRTEKADVYSFGLMMWEMYTRQRPFKQMNPRWVAQRIIEDKVRPSLEHSIAWDPEYVKLMKECWDEDYTSRPMFNEILQKLELMYDNETKSNQTLGPYIIPEF